MRWWPVAVAVNYETASDDVKEQLAEAVDLNITVFPADSPSPDSYRLQLTANIPLDIEGIIETPNKLQMVFTPLLNLGICETISDLKSKASS